MFTLMQVIQTAYECVWRFTNASGNPYRLSPWDLLQPWLKDIFFSTGSEIFNYDIKAPQAHNNWYNQKVQEGWTYDEKYDPKKKTSPLILSYAEAPPGVQMLEIFYATMINGIRDKMERRGKRSVFEVVEVSDLVQRAFDAFQLAVDQTYWDRMWEKTHKDVNNARDFIEKCASDSMHEKLAISRDPV